MRRPLSLLACAGLLAAADPITVTVHPGRVLRELSPRFAGANFVALWNPVGASAGLRAALPRLGLGHIRFPGGVPCQWWDWQDPLGSGWTTITTGTAWELAKACDAELILQTNIATTRTDTNKRTGKTFSFDASPQHQAGWLTWCREQGISVAWWEIGNEPEMDAPKERKADAMAWYNQIYGEQVKALRQADPRVRVLGPVSTNEWFWWAQGNLAKFLAAHGDRHGDGLADGISLHWYPEGGKGTWEARRATAQHWQQCWDFIARTIAEHDTRPLPVFVTEWNWAGGQDNDSARRWAAALGNADIVGMFRRTGVAAHSFFCLQKIDRGWGILAGDKDSRAQDRPSPGFFTLALADRLGRRVLALDNPADEGNEFAAYAGGEADGGVRVLLINKTGEARTVAIAVEGGAGAGRLDLLQPGDGALAAEQVVLNGVADPDPAAGPLPAGTVLDAAHPQVALPPYGVALASFARP